VFNGDFDDYRKALSQPKWVCHKEGERGKFCNNRPMVAYFSTL
jgi:hypothetical protein